MRLAWVTDLHLDVAGGEPFEALIEEIRRSAAEAVLCGGDLGQAETFPVHLVELAGHLERPVFFVLGNHDYYGGSIERVVSRAAELASLHRHLHWLPARGVVPLTSETALIGRGLFGDGRLGAAERSKLELADHRLIEDLAGLDRQGLFRRLNELGDEAAAWTREHLAEALARAQRVLFLTHVPPFAAPRQDRGRASGPEALPFYTCAAVGEVILALMAAHPGRCLTLFSGHTHLEDAHRPAPNVDVLTGGARYGEPKLQRVIEVA